MLYDAGQQSLSTNPDLPPQDQARKDVIRTRPFNLTPDDAVLVFSEVVMWWRDYYLLIGLYILLPVMLVTMSGAGIGPLIFLPALVIGVWPFIRMRMLRRSIERQPQMTFVHEFDYSFMTTIVPDAHESRIELAHFVAATVTDKFLYLFVARAQFVSIPRRAFERHDFDRLLTILSENGIKVGSSPYRGSFLDRVR